MIEEYMKQFRNETKELVVRIKWSLDSSNCSMIDDFYKLEAKIDKAYDVQTGEEINVDLGNKLEWLCSKDKYEPKFKSGNMYRVLVRESKEKVKNYYLENVLEENVNYLKLDSLDNFESKFDEQLIELTVLVKKKIFSWAIDSNYKNSSITFLASIDENNNLSNKSGILTWMVKDNDFDNLGVYKIKVRKNKENDNTYLLVDVLDKVNDSRFDKIIEEYLKPVVVVSEIGEFSLDRNYNWFTGTIKYSTCPVIIKVLEGEETIDFQLDKLKNIVSDFSNWNDKIKKYAVKDLLELSNDEELYNRIEIASILVERDGTIEVQLSSADNNIVVYINDNGDFIDTKLID